ncbi:MAG TPA: RES family NAD+ phosphorylase [Pelobium sp.]|nr:RES family NAD+ phosphorylase [Pelobium sp.]
MQVYRITLAKFADSLQASGKPARWNANHVETIYTSSSQSLSCLENVVHRSAIGLNQSFRLLTINVPDNVKITEIKLGSLPENWKDFEAFPITQNIGSDWSKKKESAILKVPSAIINQEFNYLLNPNHPDFSKIKLLSVEPFTFDNRIKI